MYSRTEDIIIINMEFSPQRSSIFLFALYITSFALIFTRCFTYKCLDCVTTVFFFFFLLKRNSGKNISFWQQNKKKNGKKSKQRYPWNLFWKQLLGIYTCIYDFSSEILSLLDFRNGIKRNPNKISIVRFFPHDLLRFLFSQFNFVPGNVKIDMKQKHLYNCEPHIYAYLKKKQEQKLTD